MSSTKPRTVADYIDENTVKVIGGPTYSTGRKERMKALVIDGRSLGDYELDGPRNKEETKHFIEIQWLAISLVGCDADLELREITTLKPRDGKATADFEATTRSDETIRIELCGVVYADEKQLFRVLGDTAEQTQKLIDKSSNPNLQGEYVIRFVNATSAEQSDVSGARRNLRNS